MINYGITDYGSYFRNYRIPDISEVSPGQIKQQEQLKTDDVQLQDKKVIEEKEPVRNPAAKNADLENISLKFNNGEDYGYIGMDSDIEKLDMQKAISDMKRDSILWQYQYFVGSAQNILSENRFEDGIVVPKFDI